MMDRDVWQNARQLYDYMSFCPSAAKEADVILALGSHDLRVPSHAADLYLAGTAPLIICTGGYGKMTEGLFARPEGELFAQRCMERGVPPSAILIENRATNTGENFRFSKELAGDRKLIRGVAVCKPYMARRALATGMRQWSEVQWFVSVPEITFDQYSPGDEAMRAEIELMVGDLQRMKLYAERGYQAAVEVPDAVWDAYEALVRAGYDRYVIKT